MLLLGITFTLYAADENPFPENKSTIFEYGEDNIPDVCFFPLSEGSKAITAKDICSILVY
jgi:hypothetical protein